MKEPAQEWQASAVRQVEADPHAIHRLFPQAGRRGGPDARRALLGALRGDPAVIRSLYEAGDSGERLAILTVLHELDLDGTAVALVEDALRTNDARLVAAALGPYGSAWLGDHSFRQGVLKCVFMSIPPGRGGRAGPPLRRRAGPDVVGLRGRATGGSAAPSLVTSWRGSECASSTRTST
ncbi:EboA domain-containing protein [Nonomuraea ferruginea]